MPSKRKLLPPQDWSEREPVDFTFSELAPSNAPAPIRESPLRAAALLGHFAGWAITEHAQTPEQGVAFTGIRFKADDPLPQEATPLFSAVRSKNREHMYEVHARFPAYAHRMPQSQTVYTNELNFGLQGTPQEIGWRVTQFNLIRRTYWTSNPEQIIQYEGAFDARSVIWGVHKTLEHMLLQRNPPHLSYGIAWE